MISAKEFRTWQASIDVEGRPIRGIEVARRFGLAAETVSRFRTEGVKDGSEPIMRLAMAAMAAEIKPWGAL